MRLPRLLAASAAAALMAGAANAQLLPIDYSNHWQPNAETVDIAFSGPGLFTFNGVVPNFASLGDAFRRCYSIDQSQGGRNQSTGNWESPDFHVNQGFAAANTIGGVDIGIVSVQGGSESDLGGDACFSPLLASPGNTGGHAVAAAALIGLISGTAGLPFPTVFDIVFQWVGTTTVNFNGFGAPATIGFSGTSGGQPNPLLVNVIYEVQGPLNGGPNDNQYYLASTTEVTGIGQSPTLGAGFNGGTGGVTNGNSDWGSSLTGLTADQTGAVASSRILAQDPVLGGIAAFPLFVGTTIPFEFNGYTGFNTPALWAIQDENEGAGGPDWRVGTAPVAVVNLRYQDHLAGGQTNTNIGFKNNTANSPAAAFDPTIIFNQPFFLFSATAAGSFPQQPFSWDDGSALGGPGTLPPTAGSILLGPQNTFREGPQRVPIIFDTTTQVILANFPQLSLGSAFIGSDDIFLDGALGGNTSYFEGSFDNGYPGLVSNQNVISGTSGFSGGNTPAAGQVNPNLRGLRIGVAAVGIQVTQALALRLTEFGSALTIVFQ